MNKILGFLWLSIGTMYLLDTLEPTRLGTVLLCVLLATYSFTDKK